MNSKAKEFLQARSQVDLSKIGQSELRFTLPELSELLDQYAQKQQSEGWANTEKHHEVLRECAFRFFPAFKWGMKAKMSSGRLIEFIMSLPKPPKQ